MFTLNRSLASLALAGAMLSGCGGGGGGSTGTTPGGSSATGGITCNTAHYTAGAVSTPTAGDMATYAKTYTGNTGTFNAGSFASDGGTASFVLNSSGALTYNSTAQTVNSICKDNTLPMIYVEFGTTGAVDFFADGTFTGNLADASLTGVHSAASAAATPTVTGFTPATGPVGTSVTISGTNLGNFTPAPEVKFGTTVATVSSASATSIVVTVPNGLAAGNSTITLSNFDGTGVLTVGTFNVTAAGGGISATNPPVFSTNLCTTHTPGTGILSGLVYHTYCSAAVVPSFQNLTLTNTNPSTTPVGTVCSASYDSATGVLTATDGTATRTIVMAGTNTSMVTENTNFPLIRAINPSNTNRDGSFIAVSWNSSGVLSEITYYGPSNVGSFSCK